MRMLTIENKKQHIVSFSNLRKRVVIRLAPGPNHVSRMAWEAVKDSPSVVARIDDGWVEVASEFEEKVDVRAFLEMNAARARKEAREMAFDESTIKSWLEIETRPSVKRELEIRMEAQSDGG